MSKSKSEVLPKPVLRAESVVLRPLRADDADVVFASLLDEEVAFLTGTHQAFTLGQVQEHCARVADADDRVDYAIELQAEPGIMIGETAISEIDRTNRSAGFRIALFSKPQFGQGYGSQATRLMLRYAFETLDLHRLELEVYDYNARAIHVYEKLGFVREGLKRDALCWQDRYYSAILMSILAPEYR